MTNTALRRRLAATIITGLPDVPGRKRLARKVFGPRTGVTQATFGPGLTFTLDLTDYDQSSAWYFQFDQPALAPLLDCVLRPGDVMVDVGANIGTYTCWAARTVGASGQVHAFEPVPGTRTVLSAHVDQNALSNVTVHPVAVGDTPGELTLFTVPGISGWSATYPRDEGSVPVTMPVVTLDDQFPGKVPRLVKIDVEGFEPQVLRGMTRLMNGDTPPIIALELCDVLLRQAGSSAQETCDLIRATGYQVHRITTRGTRLMHTSTTEEINTVLLHPAYHAVEAAALGTVRFPRDYTA